MSIEIVGIPNRRSECSADRGCRQRAYRVGMRCGRAFSGLPAAFRGIPSLICSSCEVPLIENERVDAELNSLMAALDAPSADEAEEAKYLLIERGPDIVAGLAACLPGLTGPGKVLAVEVFAALGDRTACTGLITLLDEDDDIAREWAAEALGSLGCTDAVPALTALKDRMITARVPPHWTGPVRVRRALTDLGARIPVAPPLTRSLALPKEGSALWSSAAIPDVVADLAAAQQVVLGFSLWWATTDGHRYWEGHDSVDWVFDWDSPWDANVRDACEAALTDAAFVPDGPYLPSPGKMTAHIEWIDESDIRQDPAC